MEIKESMLQVKTIIDADLALVWECWVSPAHICQWCQASDDWHVPHAENDLKAGGKFLTRMAAKDGSFSFDFEGVYDLVEHLKEIRYTLADGREVFVAFSEQDGKVLVLEAFDPESVNPLEMQQGGWQAILENFRLYVEKLS